MDRTPTVAEADQVGALQFGLFTSQVFDRTAALSEGAKRLSAAGAEGGVDNLLKFALGPSVPCNVPSAKNLVQTSTLAGAGTCVENVPGFDIFDAWRSLPDRGHVNEARLSVTRGQDIFNNKTLHVPPDLQAEWAAPRTAKHVIRNTTWVTTITHPSLSGSAPTRSTS